jgi:hypothetical protein
VGSRIDFSFQRLSENFFLEGRQVVLLVFVVHGEQPELIEA